MGKLSGYRRQYETLIDKLIARARQDPHLEDRTDILSLFLRSRYDDGSAMTRREIGDELLTLLAAGHETTASTLGWAFERISRHPDVLARLVDEVAGEGNTYRQATIFEVQRNRTVIDFAGRNVCVPVYELGEWQIPQGFSIMVSLSQLHLNPDLYQDPDRFDPQRFLDAKPNTFSWSRSAAELVAASGRHSPTWRWTSCCGPCCVTSPSRPPMRPGRRHTTGRGLHAEEGRSGDRTAETAPLG